MLRLAALHFLEKGGQHLHHPEVTTCCPTILCTALADNKSLLNLSVVEIPLKQVDLVALLPTLRLPFYYFFCCCCCFFFYSSSSSSSFSLSSPNYSIMSTIQNLKNFIRHGKQARQAPPHGDPTTNVSPVNAQQQRYAAPPPPNAQYAISDPNILDHQPLQHAHIPGANFSAANVDNRNRAAQAGEKAAKFAGDDQRIHAAGSSAERNKDLDPSVIERIVAEERESQGKLPRYPGLDRWTLLEKMGDGAFSNVYRAKDNTGRYGEAAIKVVRKFEMNSTQVSYSPRGTVLFSTSPPVHIVHTCFCLPRAMQQSPTSSRYSTPCQPMVRLGRSPPSSRVQKATKGCGGAHTLPYECIS